MIDSTPTDCLAVLGEVHHKVDRAGRYVKGSHHIPLWPRQSATEMNFDDLFDDLQAVNDPNFFGPLEAA